VANGSTSTVLPKPKTPRDLRSALAAKDLTPDKEEEAEIGRGGKSPNAA
jgi:hypothetical protein